ncbi:MAG TPA: flagellar basal body rod C-terminal domain-containing protein [Alphaproteobacteria bacterium]|nr:flagellar basal body rod C-terminal domain-containing protein [Alphaproteobacteria bacterium]
MFDAIKTALSGLLAAQNSLYSVATNVANSSDVSRLKPQAGDAPTFQPIDTVETTGTGGTVVSTFTPVTPATVTVPDPQSPLADGQGLVGLPNVDLGTQLVTAQTAKIAFEANAKVISTAKKMEQSLLNIIT